MAVHRVGVRSAHSVVMCHFQGEQSDAEELHRDTVITLLVADKLISQMSLEWVHML